MNTRNTPTDEKDTEHPMSMVLSDARAELLGETLAKEDAFNDKSNALSLARLLIEQHPPFVFAVCGSWGSGKSSFVRYLWDGVKEATLTNNVEPFAFYFNAWKATLHENILGAFIFQLGKHLENCHARKGLSLKHQGRDFRDFAENFIDAGVELAAASGGPLTKIMAAVYHSASDVLEENSALERDMKSESKARNSFDDICSILHRNHIECFVFIDELDRCPPRDIVRIMEALRQLFCGADELEACINGAELRSNNPFKFIISMDEGFVARAFETIHGLSDGQGQTYMSKMVHARYHLPTRDWTRFTARILGFREPTIRESEKKPNSQSKIASTS